MVDRAVKTSPDWASVFVTMWYRSERNQTEIANALRIGQTRNVKPYHENVLAYLLGRLSQMGLDLPDWEPED